jgi:hypothetical protein
MLTSGEVRRRHAAVVADETQDLTEASVRLLVALASGEPAPRRPSLRVDSPSARSGWWSVGGRSSCAPTGGTPARSGRRRTPSSMRTGPTVDDDLRVRASDEQAYPLRDGTPPRRHELASADEAVEWVAASVAEDVGEGRRPGGLRGSGADQRGRRRRRTCAGRHGVTARGLERDAGEHGGAIWCGTSHPAKGVEFKRVLILGPDARSWPPRIAGLKAQAQGKRAPAQCALPSLV